METLSVLGTIISFGFAAGLNLYATVLATGLAIRLRWIDLPSEMQPLGVLADTAVLIVAGTLYAIEFVADKIPVVEHAWDLLHSFVRPIGAAWLAWTAVQDVHLREPLQVSPNGQMRPLRNV
jgi:hypothetical protein